jgi:type IV pilus assembly protein PilZ
MSDNNLIYVMKDPVEVNLSYMPFITGGGLFVPTQLTTFTLDDRVVVDVQLPGRNEIMKIEGRVIWITPPNALHHVVSGIGIQFTGADAKKIKEEIESNLTKTMDVGGYTCGITDKSK